MTAAAHGARLAGRLAAPRPPRQDGSGGAWWVWLLAGAPLGLVIAVVLLVALLAGALEQQCGGGDDRAADAGRPGALGGVAGTGLTRAQLDAVRHSPYASQRLTTGAYVSTSYGPPWGGIQGPGVSTSGGVRLNRG